MGVEGGRVIEGRYLGEDGLGGVAFEAGPVFGWGVKDVVQFESRSQRLEFLAEEDVLFGLVGEEKDKFDVLILHFRDFSDDLVARSDSTSSGHEEDTLEVMLLSL